MLGNAFFFYGITALVCYFPGGYLADKFDPRKLLSLSLFMTSLGGIALLLNPNYFIFCVIYCYWGITTILFFWSALIKATRIIGEDKQGFSSKHGQHGINCLNKIEAYIFYFIKIV